MIYKLNKFNQDFPPATLANEDGLLAFGADLVASRVIKAYREGIFPWYSEGDPILWWSPNPRFILELDDFKLRRSLKKKLKHFDIKIDTSFDQVIKNCQSIPRDDQDGTWITTDVIESFNELHTLGYAHSIEAFYEGKLVGGLYGLAIGSVFCGESMFALKSDASKVAFAFLVEKLKLWGFSFIDAQVPTPHLKSLGAKEVSRDEFLEKLFLHRDDEVDVSSWVSTK